jgi:hypothetical protein
MLGFGLVLWAMLLPPMSEDDWSAAMTTIDDHLGSARPR